MLLDAGTASDLPAELLTAHARAVVVPDAAMEADARTLMCEQLQAVGFAEVTMLSKPCQPSDAVEVRPARGRGLTARRARLLHQFAGGPVIVSRDLVVGAA